MFHSIAPEFQHTGFSLLFHQHQNQKRRQYGFGVQEVERGSFTPLVFAINGAASEAATFGKRLAYKMSDKNGGDELSWYLPLFSQTELKEATTEEREQVGPK